jgi:hypothetical protein
MYIKNYLVPVLAGLPVEELGITTGAADIEVLASQGRGGVKKYQVYYVGSGAITLANYNAFPKGTLLIDEQADTLYYKTNNTTGWKKLVFVAV